MSRAQPALSPALARPRTRGLRRALVAGVPQKALRDRLNRLRHGPGAPLSDETIWVSVAAIDRKYRADRAAGAPLWRRRDSGRVVDGDWDLSAQPLAPDHVERALRARFVDGARWEETGIIEGLMADIARKGSADGMRSRAEVLARYDAVDRMFDEVARTRRLRARQDSPDAFRREHGGILVHVDRAGRPLRSGGGKHRFAIARILELDTIPCQVGTVHRAAVRSGAYAALRHRPDATTGDAPE